MVKQGVGIGPDRVKAHEAQVEQAGEADHDVQPQAQHDVDQHQRGDVHRAAPAEERPDHRDGDQQHDQPFVAARQRRRQRRQACFQRLEGLGNPRAQQLERKNQRAGQRDQVPARLHQGARALAHQLQAEDRRHDDGGHDRGDRGILERTLLGHQTFSTSGLPSSPVGRNSRISTSSAKATMSLYCDEM
ncbi:Uncharacterised protein [Bordetella pertussis]|nr:Uncharacterised protein [Bordetella pertussis]